MARKASTTAERIIRAATKRFLADGYDNTNLEDVAADAGVTKPTIYSHFGSKDKLLIAATEANASENASRMSSALEPSGDTEQDLMRFGNLFVERVQSKNAVCWHRLAVTQTRDYPEVGKAIFAAGPARVILALTNFIKAETQAGRLTCKHPDIAAEQFLGMMVGLNPIRNMTGQNMPTQAKQKRVCKEAVKTFMSAFGSEQ